MKISKNLTIIIAAVIISLGSMTFALANNNEGNIFNLKLGEKIKENSQIEDKKDIKQEDSKIINYIAPNVNYEIQDGKLLLKWGKIDSEQLLGYKIVISKDNKYPKYPENGYLAFIEDKNKTSYLIDTSAYYNKGDFGDKLLEGEKYFFSVTAFYKDKFIQGNSLEITMPKLEIQNEAPKEEVKPIVTKISVAGNIEGKGIRLKWSKTSGEKFKYYKIVLSKSNSNPVYPKDGYLTYITSNDVTSYLVFPGKTYNGGDIGGILKQGETYYFSITACYEDENYGGNSIRLKFPQEVVLPIENTQIDEFVTANIEGNSIRLNWTKANGEGFNYYKVVISKNKYNPSYPEDGYLVCFENIETNSYLIDNKTKYNSGDFGEYLKPGESYYFSVTTVYKDKKIKGNGVKLQFPTDGYAPAKQTYTTLNVYGKIQDGKIIISWDKNNDVGFLGYKVVISKSNSSPVYPGDGYFQWITDRNTTMTSVSPGQSYNGGDLGGKLVSGEKYYFSVTSVYNDAKIKGKAIEINMP